MQSILHLALTNEIRRLQISSPGSCRFPTWPPYKEKTRETRKRENPDVAHMYHGGRGRINIKVKGGNNFAIFACLVNFLARDVNGGLLRCYNGRPCRNSKGMVVFSRSILDRA